MDHRLGGVLIFLALFMTASLLTRIVLLVFDYHAYSWGWSMPASFALGGACDLLTGALSLIPFALYLALLPQPVFASRIHRWLMYGLLLAFSYGLVLAGAAELVFWNEFEVRFNFIAVDYLIYTEEVIGNIRESYPVNLILAGLILPALLLFIGVMATGWMRRWLSSVTNPRQRLSTLVATLIPPLLVISVCSETTIPDFANNYNRELAKNGIFSLFAAFRANHLDYDDFYPTMPDRVVFRKLRRLLAEDETSYLSDQLTDLRRRVAHPGAERRFNVVQITVESLSASYMGCFGNSDGLTPVLDRLAGESLFFTNLYATGTRTARGMEALTLSLPPTPGRSVVHRPGNRDLFTLGSVLREHGYDTAFIYGGYGYFDNMNEFFGKNGYRVVDRTAVPASEVSFATIWGACDEDLFRWTIAEADRSHAAGTPFHFFVMTTSNHRPFTYPDGRIDIPSGTGRAGGVRYTDYAIGRFLEDARRHPWFDDTIFVIVADHCGSSAGRAELEVSKYRIPLLIYAPGIIEPRRVETLSSQVDFAPTLLGLLNLSYDTLFFGRDLLHHDAADGRAFIGTYQTLGLLAHGRLQVLKPVRERACYRFDQESGELEPTAADRCPLEQAICYYQGAGRLYTTGRFSLNAYGS